MDNLRSRIIDLGSWLCNNVDPFNAHSRASIAQISSHDLFEMQINVLRELRQPVGGVLVFDVAERRVKLEDVELGDLVGEVRLLRTDRGLLASLEAKATMRERCARCLGSTECPLQVHFEEEYIPVLDANSGARIRIIAEEEGFRIGPDFVLDLREPLRQYVLMSEPFKPLCRPDCAGLCPSCGADLNKGSCGCTPDADERWGVLIGFETRATKGR